MSETNYQRMTRKQRRIVRRIVIQGLLQLCSPTCLGSGDAENTTDLAIVRDRISRCALLTGASITGALRSYLREYEQGYQSEEAQGDLATLLFGAIRQNDDGEQSPLIVYDSISSQSPTIELRDSVKIDSDTGTAQDKGKYDLELLAAGTQFPLQFELLVDEAIITTSEKADALVKALAIALRGLEQGDISLGMKKHRGFGRCQVKQWKVEDFNLTDTQQLKNWLNYDHWTPYRLVKNPESQPSIADSLEVDLTDELDQRDRFTIEATFELATPMLIRSGELEAKAAPDTVHLKSYRHGKPVPVISGSSLAGVLRHRAERITNTLAKPPALVNQMFGFVEEDMEDKAALASRLIVRESEIKMPPASQKNAQPPELVQTRIAIDRFTGGAYSGALFQEQPVFNSGQPQVTLELELQQPKSQSKSQSKSYEVGLLLLLLKDLWTEDLPIGGTSSIGRGRLTGKSAKISLHGKDSKYWEITQENGLKVSMPLEPEQSEQSAKDSLEEYVNALNIYEEAT